MSTKADYEKALKEAWSKSYTRHGDEVAHVKKLVFDRGFLEGYRYGFDTGMAMGGERFADESDHIPEATEKAGKEAGLPTRAQIAAMAMQGLLHDTPIEEFSLRIKPPFIAKAAVEYANALLAELGKERAV